jgi:F-type H+-transporting ATPase subunit epsilon
MAEMLTLTVVTPEASVVKGVVCQDVALPAESGQIGILPGHTPLVTLLGVGTIEYREGGRRHSLAVRDGFAEIANDVVRVLADRAALPGQVDAAATSRDREAGEAKRMEAVGNEALDAANADVAYAEARLAVAAKG